MEGNYLKRLKRLIVKLIVVIILVKATTFGWRVSKVSYAPLTQDEETIRDNLQATVRTLAQEIGPRSYSSPQNFQNLARAAVFIKERFRSFGYEAQTQTFEIDGQTFENIIVEKLANPESKEFVVVGAHYDTCFNPGADDNASGIGGLLEVARLLKNENLKTNVRFVAFANEEPPFFLGQMGSRFYTREMKRRGETVKGAIIFEMLGFYSDKMFSQRYLPLLGPFYPNRGNFVTVIGNFKSKPVVDDLIGYFKRVSKFPIEALVAPEFIPGVYFSDHWSFWQEGYPAVMVTDTAFLRNKNYHRKTDLPDTLDYEKMARVVLGLKSTIAAFAAGN